MRRLQRNRRVPFFEGLQHAASWLVRRLNADERESYLDQSQLAELIGNINALDELAERAGYPHGDRNEIVGALGSKARELQRCIDRQMDGVRLSPVFIGPTKRGWIRLWRTTENYSGNANPLRRAVFDGAVLAILDLAERGKLRNVRRCEECRQWYFARKRRQRFCKDKCRLADHRASPAGKAKWAAYMRRYRTSESQRKHEQIRLAREGPPRQRR
jgi:hypothetical protein